MAVRGHQRIRFTQCIIACQLYNQSRYGQLGILKSKAQPLELKVPQIHSTCLKIPYHQLIHHLRKMLYFSTNSSNKTPVAIVLPVQKKEATPCMQT